MELLFMLAGGLGLFLYGMNEMSRGLQQIAGARLKLILQTLTQNRFVGVLTGTVATAVLQSSSVMTVMVVSFVNANLMSLAQAISVIIGANIGTTITAQIIAFNVEEFALPIIAVGAAVALFSKRDRLKALGNTVFGFGILFYGFFLMSSAFEPFGQDPAFHDFFTRFSDQPLLGLVIGLLVTIVAQSSSLTIGITIALAHSGLITFPESLPLTIGINIGSTVTANIAAIPGSYVAKQAARA
ncbi:Na/Pi cotransporter, partial [Candidatus Peregrinibacteria bacterium CG11_big_fil_rev_8_21_14_0_20_46_8]